MPDYQNPTAVQQQQIGFAPQLAPYGESVLAGMAKAVEQPYESYADWAQKYGLSGDQVARFSDLQNQSFQGAQNLGVNGYSQNAAQGISNLSAQAGNTQYNPYQFGFNQVSAPGLQNYQLQGPANVQGPGAAQQVGTQSFTGQGTAEQYMNPYMQNVVDIQKREAQRQSGIQGTQQQGQAVQSGAFGGSRDAIMRAERERNLGTQMSDIQAQGSNAAYQQAQQQFNAEQAARLQAQQANQQAGLTTSQQNLQAMLANQSAGLNTGIQNLNAYLQTQQLGSGQNLQAQLANQQQGMSAQQAAEQSRQFGANLGLQGTQMGLQGYAALGSQGQNLYNQNVGNLNLQNQHGAQQQQTAHNILDIGQQNYAAEQNDPYRRIGFASDIVRGAPMSDLGSTVYKERPTLLSQGLGAAAAYYGATKPKAKGGAIKAGLTDLAISRM